VKINGRIGSGPGGRCRRGLQVAVRESGGPYLVRRHDSRSEGGPDVRGVLVSTAGRVGHGLDCGWRRRVGRRLDEQGRPGAGCRMSINEARSRSAWCARAPLARARGGGGVGGKHRAHEQEEKGAGATHRRGSREEPGLLEGAALSRMEGPAAAGRPAHRRRSSSHGRSSRRATEIRGCQAEGRVACGHRVSRAVVRCGESGRACGRAGPGCGVGVVQWEELRLRCAEGAVEGPVNRSGAAVQEEDRRSEGVCNCRILRRSLTAHRRWAAEMSRVQTG
jgi:hypothetical protein